MKDLINKYQDQLPDKVEPWHLLLLLILIVLALIFRTAITEWVKSRFKQPKTEKKCYPKAASNFVGREKEVTLLKEQLTGN
jgi:hypothetical protein